MYFRISSSKQSEPTPLVTPSHSASSPLVKPAPPLIKPNAPLVKPPPICKKCKHSHKRDNICCVRSPDASSNCNKCVHECHHPSIIGDFGICTGKWYMYKEIDEPRVEQVATTEDVYEWRNVEVPITRTVTVNETFTDYKTEYENKQVTKTRTVPYTTSEYVPVQKSRIKYTQTPRYKWVYNYYSGGGGANVQDGYDTKTETEYYTENEYKLVSKTRTETYYDTERVAKRVPFTNTRTVQKEVPTGDTKTVSKYVNTGRTKQVMKDVTVVKKVSKQVPQRCSCRCVCAQCITYAPGNCIRCGLTFDCKCTDCRCPTCRIKTDVCLCTEQPGCMPCNLI